MTDTLAHELLQAAYVAGKAFPFDLAVERWDTEADPLAAGKSRGRHAGDTAAGPIRRQPAGIRPQPRRRGQRRRPPEAAGDGREVVIAVTAGRLDFGPWEQVFYAEFDGKRAKRVLVKIIGE